MIKARPLFPLRAAALAVALTVLSIPALHAAPTVDEIVEKYLEAMGGKQAALKLHSRRLTGVLDMAALGGSADIVVTAKAPDKVLTHIKVPGMGEVMEGYDGKVGWSKNPYTGVIEKTGRPLEQAKRQADFHRDIKLKERYAKLEYKGTEPVNGQEAYVLRGSFEDGSSETLYIDKKSQLIVQVTGTLQTQNGPVPTRTMLSDYRTVDGIKIPFSIKLVEPAGAAFEMRINKVEHNLELDDAIFAKPAS